MKEKQLSKKGQEIVKMLDSETIKKIMTPKNDLIFKKLFGSVGREKMVKDFLEAILNVVIKEVKLGNETILLPEEIDEKTGVLDVRVTLDDGTELDIEMQNGEQAFIVKRSHFYLTRLYQSKIKIGNDYDSLKKAIVIFIANFELFSKIEEYHTRWLMTEQKNKDESFEEIELHFIELPKFLKTKYDKKRKIDQWLLYIDYSKKELIQEIMEENEMIREAEENMEKLKQDKHAQYLAWLREKQILDTNSMRKAAIREGLQQGIEQGLEEGRQQGREQGIQEGRQEGRQEGIQEGRQEGVKEAKIKIARRMFEAKMDIQVIMEMTELTQEEIEKIIISEQ